MTKTFKEALQARRSFYQLENKATLSDQEIQELIRFAVAHLPSAFNSQTARVVLLTGEAHRKLWNIAKEALRPLVPAAAFGATEQKIDGCFACGYGTVLYFEDQNIVHALQEQYPTYRDNFPVWSEHTSAMHQLTIWTLLEGAGMGASLQHYNPLIDEEVRKTWGLPDHWKLIAQMPFGVPAGEPGPKEIGPLDERVLAFTE